MTTRQKLELAINQPTEISLLYDESVSGKSTYGTYHLYAVSVGGEEFSFFPTEEVHNELKSLRKGDRAIITKLASQRGNKVVTAYEVKPLTKSVEEAKIEEGNGARDSLESDPVHDSFFDIMLNSYRNALEISRELNGVVDVHRCSITLYLSRCRQNNY